IVRAARSIYTRSLHDALPIWDCFAALAMTMEEQKNDIWWLNEESEQMLNRGYLLKGETVKGAIERITTAAAKRLYKPELQPAFEEMITKGWISFSSPVWANMGTQRGLPISCFNVHVPDNIEGI